MGKITNALLVLLLLVNLCVVVPAGYVVYKAHQAVERLEKLPEKLEKVIKDTDKWIPPLWKSEEFPQC